MAAIVSSAVLTVAVSACGKTGGPRFTAEATSRCLAGERVDVDTDVHPLIEAPGGNLVAHWRRTDVFIAFWKDADQARETVEHNDAFADAFGGDQRDVPVKQTQNVSFYASTGPTVAEDAMATVEKCLRR